MRLIDEQHSIMEFLHGRYNYPVYLERLLGDTSKQQPFFNLELAVSTTRRLTNRGTRAVRRWAVVFNPKFTTNFPSTSQPYFYSEFKSPQLESILMTGDIESYTMDKKYIDGYMYDFKYPKSLARRIAGTSDVLPDSINIVTVGVGVSGEQTLPSNPVSIDGMSSDEDVVIQIPNPLRFAPLRNVEIYAKATSDENYRKQGEVAVRDDCPIRFVIPSLGEDDDDNPILLPETISKIKGSPVKVYDVDINIIRYEFDHEDKFTGIGRDIGTGEQPFIGDVILACDTSLTLGSYEDDAWALQGVPIGLKT